MSKRIFEEQQRFTQPLIWVAMAMAIGVSVYRFIQENGDEGFITPFIILGVVIILLLSIRLKTRIDEQGIHVQMFPFHLKYVTYSWSELYDAEVVTYSPMGDYGGWGVRVSLRGKGKAFNVKGDKGIKITTADGKTRMIGTQQEDEARRAIESYKERIKTT